MRIPAFAAAAVVLSLSTPAAAAPQRIAVRLVAETLAPRPGQSFLIGLEMAPQPGWHGYWSNPGQGGLAPAGKWSAPVGVRFGRLQHPAPTLMQSMGLTSYVHSGPHVLLARVRTDSTLRPGTVLPIVADLSWAACSDKLCVPEKTRLSIRLKVGDGRPSADASLIRQALAKLPKPAPGGSYSVRGSRILLQLPLSARLRPSQTRFFPDENGYWQADKGRVIGGSRLTIAGPLSGTPPKTITGVATDGSSAYRLTLTRGK
jgi:DsbC/DsbD-like thiol-disulfide interchange protein